MGSWVYLLWGGWLYGIALVGFVADGIGGLTVAEMYC